MCPVRRLLPALIWLSLALFSLPALAEDPLYPALTDPVDQYVQSLCVMSQQDEAVAMIRYDDGRVTEGGCRPVSIANGVIAAFGVTDRETAIGVVTESLKLMVKNKRPSNQKVSIGLLPGLLDPQKRLEEQEKFPSMARTVGAYTGTVDVVLERPSAEEVISLIHAQQRPAILCRQISVKPSWEDVVRIITELHEMGLDDASLCLMQTDAGRTSSGGPLASGRFGHYLTLYINVGAFMESGALYVLDSLPRAIEGETVDRSTVLRNAYHFPAESYTRKFCSVFAASRISPTVIKLAFRPDSLAQLEGKTGEEAIAVRTQLLKPLVLFGRFPMLISLPG